MTETSQRWTEIEHLPEWDEEFYHIYTARKLGKWVMLKTLRPELRDKPEMQAMIEKEFDVRYNLAHPNIVMVNDFEDVPGLRRCIVFDDVYGTSLRKLIDTGAVTPAHVEQLRRCLPSALEYIQRNHIEHHPIRPERIIFTENIGNLKLIDVGFDQHASTAPSQVCDDIQAYGRVVLETLDASGIADPQLHSVAERCLPDQAHGPLRRHPITNVDALHMALEGTTAGRRFYIVIIAFLTIMVILLAWLSARQI